MFKKLISNKYVVFFIAFLILIFSIRFIKTYYANKLVTQAIEIKKLKIKNNKLEKVAEGHYKKLIADTLTQSQMAREIEALKLDIKNPKIVEKIVLVPQKLEKPVDSIEITDNTLMIKDYYPNKENWFTRYNTTIDLNTKQGNGEFSFSELPIDIIISEKEDGTFRADLKAPKFISVNSLDVVALPLEPTKKDNFGYLLGSKINKNLSSDITSVEIIGGIRIKKTNIIFSASSVNTLGAGVLLEF